MLSRIIDGSLRIADREKLIRTSGLFDAEWYVANYPDAGSPERAVAHFLKHSATKGNDPGPGFSTRAYLSDNPDVATSGMNPLLHYLRFGRFEGRVARDQQGRPAGDGADHGLNEKALARVQAVFDADFYRATNPDLPDEIDAFAHFMGPGWRQTRDPAEWFSTEKYLRDNPDVAGRGQNPFAHYVLNGCREARAIWPSARPRHPEASGNGKLRCGVVAMIKNEADIIRLFAEHVLALFDEVVIVDHRSDDGTEGFLADLAASHARVTLRHLEEPSYIQSVTMTHVLRDTPALRNCDWVFFLDADEFLPFSDRSEFHAALGGFERCPVISMRWRNLIPETYWKGVVEIDEETTFFVPPTASPFRKIALQPSRVPLERVIVAQGNHSLIETTNGVPVTDFDADFPIYHLPIRSVDQLMLKLNQGVLAYQKIGQSRDSAQGTHWYQMKEATASETLSVPHLNAMAMDYSEQKDRTIPVSSHDLIDAGYSVEAIQPVRVSLGLADLETRPLGETLMRLYGEDFTEAAEDDTPGATRLQTVGNRLQRADSFLEYAAFPASEEVHDTPLLSSILKDLLRASYFEIEDLVPSDWSGHVPFMFALVDYLKPRRFVELGTLRGASFFAAMQAARGRACEGIAVSPWAVEANRMEQFRNAFEDFQFLARKYAGQVGALRMSPDEALHRFEDGSIDLLHVDGLSDYDGAKAKINAWLPKLSDRGVLMIHDVNAHGGTFGVWRLWDELRFQFPSFDFRHDQGLGIACVGESVPSGLITLASAFAEDANLRTLLQQHFEVLGQQSAELFSRRFDMAQLEMRAAAEGAQSEELSWLQQELAAVRAEADDLREMVKGGLRRAAE